MLTRLAAVVEDDDLHGKETIDLSTVESQQQEEEELYEKSRNSINEEEEPEYTPTATPKETEMYEVLGVQPDSSAGQIKKAYTIEACRFRSSSMKASMRSLIRGRKIAGISFSWKFGFQRLRRSL